APLVAAIAAAAPVAGPPVRTVVPARGFIAGPREEGRILLGQRVSLEFVARTVRELHVGQGVRAPLAHGDDVVLRGLFQGRDGPAAQAADELVAEHVHKNALAGFAVRNDPMAAWVTDKVAELQRLLHLVRRQEPLDEP